MSQELKPCPFCGSAKVMMETDPNGAFVSCTVCDANGPFSGRGIGSAIDAETYARERWNNLAAPAGVTAPVPEGWKLVPVKLTEEMYEAAHYAKAYLSFEDFALDYADMLAATPASEPQESLESPVADVTLAQFNAAFPPHNTAKRPLLSRLFERSAPASEPVTASEMPGMWEPADVMGGETDIATPKAASAFPERDQSKPAEQQGIFRKFEVRRVDGSDQPGGKHHGCRYFVLDLDHDQHAPSAMRTYAAACASTHPELAADIVREFGVLSSGDAVDLANFSYRLRKGIPTTPAVGASSATPQAASVDTPELRKLGARLTQLLEDDQWNNVEPMMLAVRESIATAIHYPKCWDTAAYPTLQSALSEIYAYFKCQECAPTAQAGSELAGRETERLDFMIHYGARVAHSMDGETCNVWLPAERDGTEARPAEGYPQKHYSDGREAIDAARAALKKSGGES